MSKKPNVSITLNRDESIERAIKRFKRLCDKAGITKEAKARRYYEKPSDKRRREKRKSERNRLKTRRKAQEYNKYNKNKSRNWIYTHPKLSENK